MPFSVLPFDIPDIKKRKLRWEWAWEIKKKINVFYKKTCHKKSPTFLSFSFLIDYYLSGFFLFPSQRVSKFWKDDKILLIKIKKKLILLPETFCPKLTVSNIISAFLDYLKPKIFLFLHRAPTPPFKNLSIRPCIYIYREREREIDRYINIDIDIDI